MIEVMPQSRGAILALKASGQLTDADYREVLIPRLEEIIGRYGKARLLLELDGHGWEPRAAWDDARFGLKHRHDFEKMGVVGGPAWAAWVLALAPLLVDGEIRNFSQEEHQEALDWITA
ncbi:MAG TPA: STAS/SEC14 domain-containing protein [Gammaproteobacteria bacterium]|nr:STAS/SEC14 domain-containing protein [Gammaproteobacteria bacterium]